MMEFNMLFPLDAPHRYAPIFRDLKIFIRIHGGGYWAMFATFLMEMIKNVFDHGNGSGGLNLKFFEDGTVVYEVWDYGPGFDWETSFCHSRLKGNGTNYGLGLKCILDQGSYFNCIHHVAPGCGVRYQGCFNIKIGK